MNSNGRRAVGGFSIRRTQGRQRKVRRRKTQDKKEAEAERMVAEIREKRALKAAAAQAQSE